MEAILYNLKSLFKKTHKKDIELFFKHASKKQQLKLMNRVVKKANEDQKAVMEQYSSSK